jgi:hypothetical protein
MATRKARTKWRHRPGKVAKTRHGDQERRRRARDPAKASARVQALVFHGQRMAAAIHEGGPEPVQSFAESVDLLRRDMWRRAADAEDPDEGDALYYQAHLIRPAERPESGSPIIGIGTRTEGEPASSADAAAADILLDWLGSAYGEGFGPHGPTE